MARFLTLTLLFALGSFADARAQTDVLKRILKVNEGIETFQAEFVQTNYIEATGISQEFLGKLWLKRPEKFRMEVFSPDTQLFVSDGEIMWIYLPKTKQAIREELGETAMVPQPSRVLFQFSEKYEIDFKGENKVKDKTYYLLDLTPKEESPYLTGAKVWLSLESLHMERLVVADVQKNKMTLEFRQVKANLSLPESKFTFTPPDDVEVVEGMGGAGVR